MKHYLLGMSLLCVIGCSTHGSDASSTSKTITATEKAQVCANCHAPNAKKGIVEAPSLAGRSYDDLVVAIQKVHEYYVSQPSLMHDFKQEDIHDIATYFSNLK